MKTINLTQHPASDEQKKEGVENLSVRDQRDLKELLTFNDIPCAGAIDARASHIATFAVGYRRAMIGGAPYLMGPLEAALIRRGITPVYAFSRRESVEKIVDGKTVKTAVFKHLGFVEHPYKWTLEEAKKEFLKKDAELRYHSYVSNDGELTSDGMTYLQSQGISEELWGEFGSVPKPTRYVSDDWRDTKWANDEL